MPTSINLGKVRPTDKGEWSSTYLDGYDILDIVTSGKGSYISKVKHNTAELSDRTKWIPLVDSAAIELAIQGANEAAAEADAARLAIEGDLALKQDKIDAGLETTSKNVVGAINEVNRIVSIHHADNKAVRRWNNTLSTPIGEAVGDLDFLRELPRILGLGCYLVEDDLTKKKLHRETTISMKMAHLRYWMAQKVNTCSVGTHFTTQIGKRVALSTKQYHFNQ